MKTALVYISRHGTTEKIAFYIKSQLEGEIQLFNLLEDPEPELAGFDQVIIGGSIHYGSIQDQVKAFCKVNLPLLLDKRLGLFICCLLDNKDTDQFNRAFPEALIQHAKAKGVFEGDLIYSKLNYIERILFNPSKEAQDVVGLNKPALKEFLKNLEKLPSFESSPYTPLKSWTIHTCFQIFECEDS